MNVFVSAENSMMIILTKIQVNLYFNLRAEQLLNFLTKIRFWLKIYEKIFKKRGFQRNYRIFLSLTYQTICVY